MPRGTHTAIPLESSELSGRRPTPSRHRRWRWGWISLIAGFSVAGGGAYMLSGLPHGARLAANQASAPLLGVSLSGQGLARELSQFGHLPAVRVYFHNLPGPRPWRGLSALGKSAVVVSFRAQPSTILSGAGDSALRHFFATAPAGRPVYYSFDHEPEHHISRGDYTLAGYKAAWAHIVALARAAHNPNLHSTLILTSWTVNRASHRNFRDYLPPGHIISTLGWDSYPAGTIENRNVQLTPPAQFMGPEIAASKSVGLPYGFAEFALGTKAGRPAWLRQVGSYLAHSGAKFATYFNSTGFPTMELSDAPSIAAWRDVIAHSGLGTAPQPRPSRRVPARHLLAVTNMSVSPARLTVGGGRSTAIRFTLAKPANVTVCILDGRGRLVAQRAMPRRPAGPATLRYFGLGSNHRRLPAGRYEVLVVASNTHRSATAERTLRIRG